MRLRHAILPHPRRWPRWASPSPYIIPGTLVNGSAPSPTLVLGGLPLTKEDFRTHRAPMPTSHTTSSTTCPFAAPTEETCFSHAIYDHHGASRSNCARRTRSQTAILADKTSLRPDYRSAACSGFIASAAPAPPPKASFRSSLPPRSTRLGSTTPLGRHASPRTTPTPSNPQLDHSLPDNDDSTAAEHLSTNC